MKVGFVTIVGKPNSGKSSLMNCILGQHICITSNKPQTTRKNLKGIFNDEDSQIVFVDTPGVHRIKDNLDKYMDKSIKTSLKDVDVVILLIDIQEYDNNDTIQKFIDENIDNKNLILCINKIDLVDDNKINYVKNELLKISNKVCAISSLKNKNIKDLFCLIKESLEDGVPFYPTDTFTDTTEKEIVRELIREQCLYKLDKEIPHGINVKVNSMEFKNKKCVISADIICNKNSHKAIVIGKGGSMLKNIGFASRVSIEDMLSMKVYLSLNVVVKENWKDNYLYLKDVGYDIKEL